MRAALEVFGEAGVAATTLDQIADRAGVSKGTIYLYFASKEELFRQAISYALTPLEANPPQPAPGSPTRQLLDTISRQWVFLTSPDTVTVSRLVQAEHWQFPELAELYATEVVSRFVGQLTPIIRRGVNTGEFRVLDPLVAARMLVGLTIYNALWPATGAASAPSRKNSTEVLRELTEFYLQAVAVSNNAFPQADGAL